MEERKQRLMDRAIQRHPDRAIAFCGLAKCWDDCFTEDTGDLIFWYNVGKDTRAIAEEITT